MAKDAPATPSTMPKASTWGNPLRPSIQAASKPGDDDHLHEQADAAGIPLADQNAVDDAQCRARQHGERHHQALLAGIETEVLGDEDRQGAEQHPDREAQVEIQEAGDEGRQMTRFEESVFFHGCGTRVQRKGAAGLFRMRTAISSP